MSLNEIRISSLAEAVAAIADEVNRAGVIASEEHEKEVRAKCDFPYAYMFGEMSAVISAMRLWMPIVEKRVAALRDEPHFRHVTESEIEEQSNDTAI